MRSSKPTASMFIALAVLLSLAASPARAQCVLPDPEIDEFPFSSAVIELVGPGGTERIQMSGPSTVHVGVGPNGEAADTDGDGLDQVRTVIVQLSLTGTSSQGSVSVEIRPVTEDPFECSDGEIEETANLQSGNLDVPPFAPSGTAISFFDIFFEITVSTPMGPLVLHNREPKRMQAVIDHKPPDEATVYENPQTLPLFNEDNSPSPFSIGSARHVPRPEDVPPICVVRFVTGGVDVDVSDAGTGLASIMVTRQDNATVNVPGFPLGSKGPVVVAARKVDPNVQSVVTLKITDLSGNTTVCDPVLTLQIRENGKPVTDTVSNLPQAEGKVTVLNGSPGVRNLKIGVNGTSFHMNNLKDGEQRTLDVSSAMRPGNGNTIALTAHGKPGGSAEVVIHD